MKKKIYNTQYTDGPILLGKRIKDFLPRPEDLILKEPMSKVTIMLKQESITYTQQMRGQK